MNNSCLHMTILFWANEPFFQLHETIQFWGFTLTAQIAIIRHISLWASSESSGWGSGGWVLGTLEQTLEEARTYPLPLEPVYLINDHWQHDRIISDVFSVGSWTTEVPTSALNCGNHPHRELSLTFTPPCHKVHPWHSLYIFFAGDHDPVGLKMKRVWKHPPVIYSNIASSFTSSTHTTVYIYICKYKYA